MAFALPVKLSASQPTSFPAFTLLIPSPTPPWGERASACLVLSCGLGLNHDLSMALCCLLTSSEALWSLLTAPSPPKPAVSHRLLFDPETSPSPVSCRFPTHLQPAGSTAVSCCNEVIDTVSPADLLKSSQIIIKFVLNLIALILPSKGVCILKHMATARAAAWPVLTAA